MSERAAASVRWQHALQVAGRRGRRISNAATLCCARPAPPTTRRYGILVLSVEVLGGLAMLPYGLCLTARVTNGTAPPPDEKGQLRTALPYHIRVVVPCSREPLDVIQKTVTAALVAPIPANCLRTGEQRLGVGSTPS